MHRLARQRGVTLVELLVAMAVSAILLAGISGVTKLGLDAQSQGRNANELTYQGRFALERMADQARIVAAKVLTTPAANTTGDWFAPTGCSGSACVMYCLNGSSQLIETTTSDVSCTGSNVIASNVTAFAAAPPALEGPTDRSVATASLGLGHGTTMTTLSSSIRLGGGTQ